MKLSLLVLLFPLLSLANPVAIPAPAPAPVPVPAAFEPAQPLAKRETALNAFLTVLLEFLPALDASISSLVGVLTAFETLLALLTGDQVTYNELGGTCKPYTLVFARGTTEPGNVGILVGPPFISALKSAVGSSNLTTQGVNSYAASVDGYLAGGDATGSATMAVEIESVYKACPNTKIIVSGYSQGGQLVHNSIALLPTAVQSWISKVVIFGDPYEGQTIPNVATSKILVYCHDGDNICVNGDLILPAHLTYAENVAAAAAFVAS